MKKIGIIGYGYVGKGIHDFFKDHYEIMVYEVNPKKEDLGIVNFSTQEEINKNCDMAVICVPTPMFLDGSVDTLMVESSIQWLETPVILLKSTVPPGTTEKLVQMYKKRIAFSPEYMGESKYVTQWWLGIPDPKDMKKHDFQIFGGERETTSEILEYFKVVLGPIPKLIQTDSKTAELTKYMENCWGATKVMFCNEFAKIAETFNVDYDELRELWLLDGRIHRMHTAVFKDKRGFGGKCFPKDIHGMVRAAEKAGYVPELLKEVIKSNERIQDIQEAVATKKVSLENTASSIVASSK